jgi:hypothetical protein
MPVDQQYANCPTVRELGDALNDLEEAMELVPASAKTDRAWAAFEQACKAFDVVASFRFAVAAYATAEVQR